MNNKQTLLKQSQRDSFRIFNKVSNQPLTYKRKNKRSSSQVNNGFLKGKDGDVFGRIRKTFKIKPRNSKFVASSI